MQSTFFDARQVARGLEPVREPQALDMGQPNDGFGSFAPTGARLAVSPSGATPPGVQ